MVAFLPAPSTALVVLVPAGGAACAVAWAATPLARRLALRTGFVDRPVGSSAKGVPLLGGVAVIVAVAAALLGALAVHGGSPALAAVVGAALMAGVGLVDDRLHLGARVKLAFQLLAGLILWLGGLQVALPLPGWANLSLTLFWIVGITNALNLLDNMDGLSTGVSAIAALAIAGLAFAHGQLVTALVAAVLAGACLGFLSHNFSPASIYLGDAGSLFLGFCLATLGLELRFPDNTNRVTWLVPILILAPAILDTTLVCWSRLRRGLDPLSTPGKDHLSHRLVLLGLTPRGAVLTIYALATLCAGLAVFVSDGGPVRAAVIAVSVLVGSAVLIGWLDRKSLRRTLSGAARG